MEYLISEENIVIWFASSKFREWDTYNAVSNASPQIHTGTQCYLLLAFPLSCNIAQRPPADAILCVA